MLPICTHQFDFQSFLYEPLLSSREPALIIADASKRQPDDAIVNKETVKPPIAILATADAFMESLATSTQRSTPMADKPSTQPPAPMTEKPKTPATSKTDSTKVPSVSIPEGLITDGEKVTQLVYGLDRIFSKKYKQEEDLATFQMSDMSPQKVDNSFNPDLIPESVNPADEWPLESIVHELPDGIVRDFDQWFDSFSTWEPRRATPLSSQFTPKILKSASLVRNRQRRRLLRRLIKRTVGTLALRTSWCPSKQPMSTSKLSTMLPLLTSRLSTMQPTMQPQKLPTLKMSKKRPTTRKKRKPRGKTCLPLFVSIVLVDGEPLLPYLRTPCTPWEIDPLIDSALLSKSSNETILMLNFLPA